MTILKLKIPYVRSSLSAPKFLEFREFWKLSSLATLKFPSEGQRYLRLTSYLGYIHDGRVLAATRKGKDEYTIKIISTSSFFTIHEEADNFT